MRKGQTGLCLKHLNYYPVDPIMIGADYFAQDPRDDKLNLTVGVYQDEHDHTAILQAVKLKLL